MRQTRAVELSTGLFVLLGFAALFFLTTQITNRELKLGDNGYHVSARFENIGSLKIGAPVSMAGVTVGRVESITLDQQEFKAVVKLRINSAFNHIPVSSDASIFTAGLLGGQYIGIGPGGGEEFLKDGDEIEFTQSAIVLENLISKFLFSMTNKNRDEEGKEQATQEKTP